MTRPRYGFAMGGRPFPPFSPLLKEHERRGGSGTAALTNTLDPSEYPTAPPQSSYHGGIPKIGGSEGGFFGLLVGLIVLILVCCCIVFYLLSTRKHGGAHARRASRSSSSPATPAEDTKGLLPSFLPFQKRRRQKAGWIQQGDEFEYASDEDLMAPQAREVPKLRDDAGYMGTSGSQQQLSRAAPPAGVDAYSDPFDPDHLPESVHRQQAPLPTAASSHGSPLTEKVPQESPTTPTFEGGTKFKEQF